MWVPTTQSSLAQVLPLPETDTSGKRLSECVVQYLDSYLQKLLGSFFRPPHLLFFAKRLLMISLTVDSTNADEMVSPLRYRSP